MTNMQVEYNKLVETRRHNMAQERLSAEANAISKAGQQEAARHNWTTEALSAAQLAEQIRHQTQQDTETMRHNLVSETEITRHNQAQEAQAKADNALKQYIAEQDNATKILTTQMSNQNARELEAMKQKFTAQQNELDRAIKQYTADTDRMYKESQIAQRDVELQQQAKRLSAEVQNMADTLALKVKQYQLDAKKTLASVLGSKAAGLTASGGGLGSTIALLAGIDAYSKYAPGASDKLKSAKQSSSTASWILTGLEGTAFLDSPEFLNDPVKYSLEHSVAGKLWRGASALYETASRSNAKHDQSQDVKGFKDWLSTNGVDLGNSSNGEDIIKKLESLGLNNSWR